MSEPEDVNHPFDRAIHRRMGICFNICEGASIEDLELIAEHNATIQREIRAKANVLRLTTAESHDDG